MRKPMAEHRPLAKAQRRPLAFCTYFGLAMLALGGCYTPYKTAVLPYEERMSGTAQQILLHAKAPVMLHVAIDAEALHYTYKATVFAPPVFKVEQKTVPLARITKVDAYATGVVLAWSADKKLLLNVVCWNNQDARYLAAALMALAERRSAALAYKPLVKDR